MSIDPVFKSLDLASAGMDAQSFRLRLASENLSNADTPGYQRKIVSFQLDDKGVRPGPVRLDRQQGEQLLDPSHPLADENGLVTLSNVDMMLELADIRDASRSYEANLQVFSQARGLYEGLLSILKR